jgi:hypothetical protein
MSGAAIGYLIGFAWDKYLQQSKAYLLAVVGGVIGVLILPGYRWLISGGKQIELDSVEVGLPFVGTTLTVKLSDAHRLVGWKLFVESATRITTQSLDTESGVIREALTSLHGLFDIVRGELKNMKPSPPPSDQNVYTIESYAILMLNDGLRQMLSRWHPRLLKWEKTTRHESKWPLNKYCRRDLETTRTIILAYTWGLGEMVKVWDLEHLLPRKPEGPKPQLISIADIQVTEKEFECKVSDAERTAGWHIIVELTSRIATQPLGPQSGLMSEALSSLKALFDSIRTELKEVPPPPPSFSAVETNEESVEGVAMSILNRRLRPFLAKWHPELLKWEKDNSDKTEAEWPERENCRQQLETLQKEIVGETKKLSELIGVKYSEVAND